jgi:hypothetical protein
MVQSDLPWCRRKLDGLVRGLRVSGTEVRTTPARETRVTAKPAADAREPRSDPSLGRRTVPTLPTKGATAHTETPPSKGRTSG